MTDKEKDENGEEKASAKKEVNEEEGKRYSGGAIPKTSRSSKKKED